MRDHRRLITAHTRRHSRSAAWILCAHRPGQRLELGFTLIELLVTSVIVGILATAAYSTYQKSIIRANRSAAEQFMVDIANRQTQYLMDARSYANSIGSGGLGLNPSSTVTNNYNVTIALSAGPPPGFVITATPIGRQTPDGALTLDDTGQKLPADKW